MNEFPTIGTQNLLALSRFPDRIAFSGNGMSFTYRGAADLVARMQAVFSGLGLPAGTVVAILSSNRAEAYCAGVAAHLCRLVTTWLHPLASLEDQCAQISDAQAYVLIADSGKFLDRGEELSIKADALKIVLTLGRAGYGRDLLAAANGVGAVTARCQASAGDRATLFYTSGTTGKPKGAIRGHREHGYYATACNVNFELPATPKYLASGPISHVTGTNILPTLMKGGTVHLLDGFNPDSVLHAIVTQRINFALMVPTMVYSLLDHPRLAGADVSSLELLLYGAAPMSPTRLEEGIERFGPIFSQLFGQTECHPISVLRKGDHDLGRPEMLLSCGFPALGCDVRILNDDCEEIEAGELGEICVRAPQVMTGYLGQPEQSSEALRGGWLHTGDIGRTDDRGYLYLVDRKKDMIVSGGFNVYPKEVENVLATHQDVSAVAVIGVPHEKWGEAVTAIVVLKPSVMPDKSSLVDLVKARKGSIYAPKEVHFVSELPLNSVGKVDKNALRAPFWAGRKRQIG